jgi:predicted RNase H-like HicB family nuclease
MLMTSRLNLYTTLTAKTVQLDERWCATQDGLGLYAYGKSAEEASSRLLQAVDLLLETLMENGGPDAVTRELEKAGIALNQTNTVKEPLSLALPLAISLESP